MSVNVTTAVQKECSSKFPQVKRSGGGGGGGGGVWQGNRVGKVSEILAIA